MIHACMILCTDDKSNTYNKYTDLRKGSFFSSLLVGCFYRKGPALILV